MVIAADPIPDHATLVLQGFESVTMNALVLERSDDPLDHSVRLGAAGCDEFLLQAVAFDQDCVASTGEDQAIVRSKKERRLDTVEMAVSSHQGLLQCRLNGLGLVAAAQMPTQQFPCVEIDHQSQLGPVVAPTQNSAHTVWPIVHSAQQPPRARPESSGETLQAVCALACP